MTEAQTGSAAREAEEFAELLNARSGAPTEDEMNYLATLIERADIEQERAVALAERGALAADVAAAIGAEQDRRDAAKREQEQMMEEARRGDWTKWLRQAEEKSAVKNAEEAAKKQEQYRRWTEAEKADQDRRKRFGRD